MKNAIVALSVFVVLLCVTAPSDASFQVTFTDTASAATLTVVDGSGLNGEDGSADGVINVNVNVGSYTYTASLSRSNTPGLGGIAFVITGTGSVTGSGATTLSVYASADGFVDPSAPPYPGIEALSNATDEMSNFCIFKPFILCDF